MITLKGKYNIANIMIDEIDETTREQIQSFLNHPAFGNTYIAVMQDCHAGVGSCVGFTMKMNKYIIPNIIGVDCGCGLLHSKFNLDKIEVEKLDDFIKGNIPYGSNINQTKEESIEHLEENTKKVCEIIGIDSLKALRAVGSLGGNNHFIEVGIDKDKMIGVTIHSGSRNFGKCVADFYQKKAKEKLEMYFLKDQYKDLEFLHISDEYAEMYLYCLDIAQQFAIINRQVMMNRISKFLGVSPVKTISSVHNFIDSDQIIRKGATPARKGQDVIIPFNMRDGIAIGIGKGSSKYNYSSPHGAGRIMSRTQAKKTLSLTDFQNDMKNSQVYTTTVNESTLDEAPGAYKDKDLILKNIEETVEIIDFIKPIYNFKASE